MWLLRIALFSSGDYISSTESAGCYGVNLGDASGLGWLAGGTEVYW